MQISKQSFFIGDELVVGYVVGQLQLPRFQYEPGFFVNSLEHLNNFGEAYASIVLRNQ